MNKALRYFILAQLYVCLGIGAALALTPEGINASVGLSYFSTQLASLLPFSGGLLAMAAYLMLAFRALPEQLPSSFKWGWLAMTICVFGLALSPFGFKLWFAQAHIIFSFALFLSQFLMFLGLAVTERTRRAWFLAMLAAISLVTLVRYWGAVLDVLLVGQLIFQTVFVLMVVDTLRRYGEQPAAAPKRSIRPATSGQSGFTLIELMIATSVFSLVLLLISYGLLQIGRTYNKGLTNARTQEATRSIIDEISRAIQFSGGTIATTPVLRNDGVPYVLCIDERRYSIVTDRQLKDSPENANQLRNVLVVDTYPGCNASTPALPLTSGAFVISNVAGARELLPANMRVARLEVISRSNNLYEITVRIVAGEDELLDAAHDNCQNVRAGTQFCAVSELTTVVQKRL